jgi:hypothetical protein
MSVPVVVCGSRWRVERDSFASGPQEDVVACAAVATCQVMVRGEVFDMCPVCATESVSKLGGVMITAEVAAQSAAMVDHAEVVRGWKRDVEGMVPEIGEWLEQVAQGLEGFQLLVLHKAYQHLQPGGD